MKADQVLIEHHDVLRGLLKKLGATTDEQGATRRKLLDELVSELGVHVRIEDELFYPAVQEVTPLLAISQAEHRQIDDQLAVVLRTDPGGPDFLIELNMLIATLEHHAGEEARVMFPQSHALGEAALESLLVVGADHHATARPRSWARIRGRGQRRSGSQPAATDGVSQGAGEADAQVALRPGPARLTCSSAAFSGIQLVLASRLSLVLPTRPMLS